jgi:hypothetical protein
MKRLVLCAFLVLASASLVFAAAKTGDISVDSKADSVTNVGQGQNVQSKTDVHSVDVKEGGKTGDIKVKGTAGNVTNVGYGQNVKTETKVGSVKVGGQ